MKLSDIPEVACLEKNGRQKIGPAQKRNYQNTTNRLVEYFGDIEVSIITPDDLADWSDWLEIGTNAGPVTRNSYRRAARAIWNRLRRPWRKLNVCDPTHAFEFEPEPKSVRSITDRNHYKLVMASGIRDALMATMVRRLGVRRGGLASMRVDRMSLYLDGEKYRGVIRVVEKGNKERPVFVDHETGLLLSFYLEYRRGHLSAIKKEHNHLFYNLKNGEPLKGYYISNIFYKMKQRADIPREERANAHAARHAFAQEKLAKGVPLAVVSQVMGHESVNVTADIYGRMDETRLMEALFRPDEDQNRRKKH